MDWRDIPSEFRFLLDEIQKTDPQAIIAGGSLRDWFHGHTPKDIDIFVTANFDVESIPQLEIKKEQIEHSGDLDETILDSVQYDGYSKPINIITCSEKWPPDKQVDKFDFGLCKISWDGQNIFEHSEFLWDVKHHLFTLRRPSAPCMIFKSIERYKRLRDKYPFPLMIPHDLTILE